MKSSVEARVAVAITASFVALTLGAMTQENSVSATRRHVQNNRANVVELTKDGSLADLATGEIMRATDYANRNEGEHEDKDFKF
jgi:hypothetical protein